MHAKLEAANAETSSVREKLAASEAASKASGVEVLGLKKAFDGNNRKHEQILAERVSEIAALTTLIAQTRQQSEQTV